MKSNFAKFRKIFGETIYFDDQRKDKLRTGF